MKFALVQDDQVIGFRHYDEAPTADQIKHVDGLPMLRPVQIEDVGAYDAALYDREGPVFQIEPDLVTELYVLSARPGWAETLRRRIDEAAEAARMTVITGGAGQSLVYAAKEGEAKALLALIAANPEMDTAQIDIATYPHLAAEIGITADALRDVAWVVVEQAAAWRQISARIESARLRAKQQIRDAADLPTALAAALIDWALIVAPPIPNPAA